MIIFRPHLWNDVVNTFGWNLSVVISFHVTNKMSNDICVCWRIFWYVFSDFFFFFATWHENRVGQNRRWCETVFWLFSTASWTWVEIYLSSPKNIECAINSQWQWNEPQSCHTELKNLQKFKLIIVSNVHTITHFNYTLARVQWCFTLYKCHNNI